MVRTSRVNLAQWAMDFLALTAGWIGAVQCVALWARLPGLHALPRRTPRAALVMLVPLSAGLLAWPALGGDLRIWAWCLAPSLGVGVSLGLLLACAVPRRPEQWWRHSPAVTDQTVEALDISLGKGQEDAGALLLRPRQAEGGEPGSGGEGARQGTVVVLAHGGGNDRLYGMWYLVDCLTRRGLQVLTAHLPGHGRGGQDVFTLEAGRGRLDLLVTRARELAGQGRVVILGQSLGASLALDLTARGVPVDAVVSVSAPVTLNLGPGLLRELCAFFRPAVYGALAYGNPYEALPAVGWFKREAFPIRVCDEINPHAGVISSRAQRKPPDVSYVRAFEQALSQMALDRRLQTDGCPVLLVQGDRDGVVPAEQARCLAQIMGKRARLLAYTRVTHLDGLLDRRVVGDILQWVEQAGAGEETK